MTENDIKNLISKALTARKNSYSPYSQFAVGSALLSNNGEIFLRLQYRKLRLYSFRMRRKSRSL